MSRVEKPKTTKHALENPETPKSPENDGKDIVVDKENDGLESGPRVIDMDEQFDIRLKDLKTAILEMEKHNKECGDGTKQEISEEMFENIMDMKVSEFMNMANGGENIKKPDLRSVHDQVSGVIFGEFNEEYKGSRFRQFMNTAPAKAAFAALCLFLKFAPAQAHEATVKENHAHEDKIENLGGGGKTPPLGDGKMAYQLDPKEVAVVDSIKVSNKPAIKAEGDDTNEKMDARLEEQRAFYLKSMYHPAYKKRLAKEMFGDQKLTDEMKEAMEKEYEKRIENIKTVKLIYVPETETLGGSSDSQAKLIKTDPKYTYHEFSHQAEINPKQAGGKAFFAEVSTNEFGFNQKKEALVGTTDQLITSYSPEHAKIIKDYETSIYSLMTDLWEEIEAKYTMPGSPKFYTNIDGKLSLVDFQDPDKYERYKYLILNYDIENNMRSIADRDLVDKFTKAHQKEFGLMIKAKSLFEMGGYYDMKAYYWGSTTELKARINLLRTKAAEEFGYDYNKEFHIEDYPKLKEEPNYIESVKVLNLSDKDLDELAKYIALYDDKSDTASPSKEALA